MTKYEHWRTMSIPWRLATLAPTLAIAAATIIAVLYAPAISAKAVAVGAGLFALQATCDHYRAHDYRDLTLMVGALATAGTITPLVVASPLWQGGLLLALIVALLAGYRLRRWWSPSIVGDKPLRIGLPVVAILPLLVLYLYTSVVAVRMQMVHVAGVLVLLMGGLGYWHAHLSLSSQRQRPPSPQLLPAGPATAGRLPAKRWNARGGGE